MKKSSRYTQVHLAEEGRLHTLGSEPEVPTDGFLGKFQGRFCHMHFCSWHLPVVSGYFSLLYFLGFFLVHLNISSLIFKSSETDVYNGYAVRESVRSACRQFWKMVTLGGAWLLPFTEMTTLARIHLRIYCALDTEFLHLVEN